eukprot:TRINITY_DN50505_c0_g1_i2.p1 TRINITY_DN50505_c0_g1~~TRINITY_DN50505_c0_g1_i2.p1  ORF type:complete len:225 (-),score=29.96 TRINITY_DN50505_c0_g1_i2:27-653(-)
MTPSKDLLRSLLPSQPQLPQNALLQQQQQQSLLGGGVQQSLQGKGLEQLQQQQGLEGFQDGSQSMFLQRNIVDKPIDPPQRSQAPVGPQVVAQPGALDPKLGWSTVQKGKTLAEMQAEQLKVGLGVSDRGRVIQAQALNNQAGGQKMAWNANTVPAPQSTDVHKTFRDIQLEEERLHKQQQQLSVKQLNAKNEVTFAVSADGNAPAYG